MPTRVIMSNGGVEAGGFLMGRRVGFKDVEKKEENGLVKNSFFQNNISCSNESSSSIGVNSDLSENSIEKSGDGDQEVESQYKGGLDAMGDLEEVLPIRRGISRFYNGKSKSFASLANASSSTSSIKDIAKPDNPYIRKRRNLLSCSLNWDKNRNNLSPRSNISGISKRTAANSSRTTLALALAMSNSDSDKNDKEFDSPGKDFSPWRSFSLVDLQHCVSVAKTCADLNSNH